MDFVLNRLTDLGLRRVYKFLLKRTIGKYLEDELLIDQLEVVSRDGVVKLRDIRLKVDVLNEEFFKDLPVKVVSLHVSELQVHISYRTLLTDSCRFVIDCVTVELAPSDRAPDSPTPSDAPAPTPLSAPVPAPNTSDEGQKGLSFIANWVEVVVARLQVQVGKVSVRLKMPQAQTLTLAKASKTVRSAQQPTHDILLTLTDIQYFNDDPRVYSTSESAVALSTKLTSGTADATALQLGAKKVRTVCL
ncbi:hypothetical protein B484DRAFT_404722 [Ochromonadaceae sp. CCMP2298]|nr:hypothetical protein B484DRAFT_404722 [Ochromonadaceae sp. CCMP2298]